VTFLDPIAWERSLPIRPSSPAWVATVRALYGTTEPEDEALFRELSGGREPPAGGADELLVVAGRRGGKSETIARVAVFEALHGGHQLALAPGQVGLIPVISPLREQSGEIVRYCHGLASLPQVRPFVDGDPTRDGVRFTTGIEIRCVTADAVAVSGATVVAAIREELAKFPDKDSANGGDVEIDNSLRPALAPVVGAPRRRLIGITSAYLTEGIAYETEQVHYGRNDADVLVVRGTTEQFNPAIDTAWLERERRRVGERVFAREYLGTWQDAAIESWFGADVIDGCVDTGRGIAPPVQGHTYYAGVDLGVRVDGTALCIAHRDRDAKGQVITVIDGCWYWPPRSRPMASIVQAASQIIRNYHASGRAFADQFHYDSVKNDFEREHVTLKEAPWTSTGGRSKTIRFNSIRVEMINGALRLPGADRDLIREFHNLSGRLRRTGTEELAARTGHDDRLHACVLVASEILNAQPSRSKWPGTWTHEEYIEAKERWFQGFGSWFGGAHVVFNLDPEGGRPGRCLSYPELRRCVEGRLYPFDGSY
jgi:hypothetical protein